MDASVNDATVSDAAEGVFVGIDPANTTLKPPSPEPETQSRVQAEPVGFSEADLAKAREQEKAKLYPQIDQLKNELAELKRDREERLEAERIAQEEADRQAREQQEAEMDVRELLSKKEMEWEQRLEQERLERENAIALLEKEREFSAITEYRTQRLAEIGDDIIPELRDLVTGNTKDEIDASIAGLAERSSRILEGAQAAMQQARSQMQGTRVTAPVTELDTDSAQKQFSPEEIAAMSMADYQKYRSTLLGQSGDNNRGLFG